MIAEHGGKHTEAYHIAKGVQLNAKGLFVVGAVLLGSGNGAVKGIAETANSLKNVLEINIEPYHPLGSGKSETLGKEYALKELTFPEEATVTEWIAKVASMTAVPVKKA